MKKLLTLTFILFSFNANAAEEKTYTTIIKNHKFHPAIIEVEANTKFKLIVDNQDKTLEEFESHDLRKEKYVKGGKKITIKIRGLKAGEYKFFGEMHEDTAQGKIIAK